MKKVENQYYVSLYRYEIFCYIVIWASGIIYASYNVLHISLSKYFMLNFLNYFNDYYFFI